MSSAYQRLLLPLAIAVTAGVTFFAVTSPFDRSEALAAPAPVDPTGTWLVEDGDARIRLAHCPRAAARICGYLVWAKEGANDGADRDGRNPDPTKRGRPIRGMQILLGLEAQGATWSGPVYNAVNGKTYDAHVTRRDDNHLTLKGCVLRYLCQSQTWIRVGDVAAGLLVGAIDGPGGPRSDPEWAASRGDELRPRR